MGDVILVSIGDAILVSILDPFSGVNFGVNFGVDLTPGKTCTFWTPFFGAKTYMLQDPPFFRDFWALAEFEVCKNGEKRQKITESC